MSYAVVTLKKGEGRTLKAGGPGYLIMRSRVSPEDLTTVQLCWYTTLMAIPWDGDSSIRIPRSEFE